MNYREKFAERLIYLREQNGITQQELADKLKITRQSLSLYEKAERTINIELLAKIADFFKVSTDYLMGRTDVASVEADIKTACEVTGLSDKTIKNIKLVKSEKISFKEDNIIIIVDEPSDIINMILSADCFQYHIELIGIYFNKLINKYLKEYALLNLNSNIGKLNFEELDSRNKLQKEWEDLSERILYDEFRLTKIFKEFLEYIDDYADYIAHTNHHSKKESVDNAYNNPQEE